MFNPIWVMPYLLLPAMLTHAASLDDGQVIRDWTARCTEPPTGQRRCLIYQTLVSPEDERPMLQISVGYLADSQAQPAALITVPLGVSLPAGLRLNIDDDDDPVILGFDHCHAQGCVAGATLDNTLLEKMKRGLEAKVTITDIGGQNFRLAISLLGFTRAFEGLEP